MPCVFGRAPPSIIGNPAPSNVQRSGGSPAPTPPRLTHLTSKPRAPARTYSRAACAGFGYPPPSNVQRTNAGGSPAPLVLPPRARGRRHFAAVGSRSGYRSRSTMSHRLVFGRWPCSPLGLCSPLPALVHRGFAARLATIVIRSVLRVPALDQRYSVVPFRPAGRFITYSAWGLRLPIARLTSIARRVGRSAGPPRRPASARRPLRRASAPRPRGYPAVIALFNITPAAAGAFSLNHYVTPPRTRSPRAAFQSEPSPVADSL